MHGCNLVTINLFYVETLHDWRLFVVVLLVDNTFIYIVNKTLSDWVENTLHQTILNVCLNWNLILSYFFKGWIVEVVCIIRIFIIIDKIFAYKTISWLVKLVGKIC